MAVRDVYLKIETIPGYSPVRPEDHSPPPRFYGRDCMRSPGHDDGTIPDAEINARTLTALIYREYLDPGYVVPKPDKLVVADLNEPVFDHRVPGTVIYCYPGDRVRIHVLNWDTHPHSLHMHGLAFGIDSDGSWPFGTQTGDGRRSDEICPGQSWTYIFDVTDEMVGAWPFHDHHRHINESVNRGLFGGLVVLPKKKIVIEPPDLVKLPRDLELLVEKLCRHPLCLPGFGPRHGPGAHEGGSHRHFGVHGGAGPQTLHGGGHGGGGGEHVEKPLHRAVTERELAMILEGLHEYAQLDYVHPIPPFERVLHVPIFFHMMQGTGGMPAFDSPDLVPGGTFEAMLGAEGVFGYRCRFHPNMQGTVNVVPGGAELATVTIRDSPDMIFDPPAVTVRPGGTVRWENVGAMTHSATENGGGMATWCLNGRAFVGNSPTILAWAGQKIRWYVFNLDLGMMWHNFHLHGQRWDFAGEPVDVRSIGPAESFTVETTAPPALLLPPEIAATQPSAKRPYGAKRYIVYGDFIFHCHVEMHMMQGLVGLVRSRQTLWLTDEQAEQLRAERGLPLYDGGNDCPEVDEQRCHEVGCGHWEEVPGDPEVAMMHANVLPGTDKVLYWGYTRADQTRLWEAGTGAYSAPANQPADVAPTPGDIAASNLWSAEHAFLDTPQGTLLAHGGFASEQAYLFDPATLAWSRTGPTAQDRFYSTTLTLEDGRVLTLIGGLTTPSLSIEVYDPAAGTWASPIPLPPGFLYRYYPWTYLLPGGDLFIAGPTGVTRRFAWAAPVDDPLRTWNTIAGNRSTGGEKGTSVLLPLRPPGYEPRVLIAGGNLPAAQQTAEIIDLSAPTPAWSSLPNLNLPRPEQFTAVLLPDGQVLVAGGVFTEPDGGPAEIFDPSDPAAGWMLCASMQHKRGYHSSNILLPDGSVLMGGDPPAGGGPTPHERYFPWYFSRPRPAIAAAPATVAYGATFAVDTPQAASIAEAVLLKPGSVTHGFNMGQRFVGCAIVGSGASSVQVEAPPDGTVAPPGWYLLFLVDASRVPSVGRWVRVRP